MASKRLLNSASLRKQALLTEFAGLRTACPPGVFMCLTPGDPTLWAGVIFVRQGPYAPAILRLQISFPSEYPALPPLVTLSTDIFHPLLTPLSTLTYTTDIQGSGGTVSATDDERLPPGGFSLRHGFPSWYNRTSKSPNNKPLERRISIYEVLDYIRTAFDDEKVLDSVPLDAAANTGAWHAWRSYRIKNNALTVAWPESFDEDEEEGEKNHGLKEQPPLPSPAKLPGQWNWDGVWEVRAKRGIDSSLTEPVLYGNMTAGDDLIHFLSMEEDQILTIQENVKRSLETT